MRFARLLMVSLATASGLFLFAPWAMAQTNTAGITGVVKDASGGVIPGASVTAIENGKQLKFTAATNETGQYALEQLPLGEYSLSVSAAHFKTIDSHLTLHAGDRIRQDFALEVGEIDQVVVVGDTTAPLQEQSAEIKDVIENQQVLDLPQKNREFLELALLSEGVVNPPGGTRGDSLQQTGKLINILGQRTGHNLFLLDGVSITDEYFNNVAVNPSLDSIREFNIEKTNYSAEFGSKSGGVINVVTKSGTNALHGDAYEFFRNNIFDARNFFDPAGQPAPPFHENQFGAALGGPVIRNKTFFFVNYEGQVIRESLAHIFSVPTATERSGNFSGLATITNPITHQPFPGNVINLPLSPAAVALLAKVPLPNLPGGSNNLLSVATQSTNSNQYNARLDHQFSLQDTASARVSVLRANETDPFGSSVLNEALLPGFGRTLDTHSVNVAVSEIHTFSPNVLNEVRFGWLSVSGGQGDPNAGSTFAGQYGLQGTTTNPKDFGYPQVSLSNVFTTMGDATGFTTRVDRNFEFFENATAHRGAHTLQFGAYFFHLSFNPSFPNDARGVYTFSGQYTGNALADFLLGYPSQAQVGIGEGAENAHTDWAHLYVQDGWQATHNLKIDAGLRYEFNENLVAQPNQTSDIDLAAPGGPAFVVSGSPSSLPSTAAALAALSPIPVISAASAGWNNSLLRPKSLRLSPRIGLAWAATSKTVVRAGFGIYTNQAAYSVLQNLAENLPFFLVKTVSNSATVPAYTMQNILAANSTGTIGANSVNHNFAIEYNEVWNATVQRALSPSTTVEAEYIGSRTVHADSSTAVNVPMTFGGPRPYPNLNAFTTIRWDGWATFEGLTLKAVRRSTSGFSFYATYTWSKSMDDASDAGTTNAEYNLPQNPYAPAREKADSSFDHRNRFTANAVYPLPFAKTSRGWMHRTLSGWRASGSVTVQSGAPFTVNLSSAAGQDVAHIGLVSGNNLERPNLVSNPNNGPHTAAEWFNTAAFVLPAQNTFGSAGRNVVTGPGLASVDLSLQKEGTLHEGLKLQFRLDLYNALNHPNFDLPGRIFGAANFGVITSAEDPREFQFALKLMF
jgi:Carboxypeptidase regulatory-like domain